VAEMWNNISGFEMAEYQLLAEEDKKNREKMMLRYQEYISGHPRNSWLGKKKKSKQYPSEPQDFYKMNYP